MGSKVRSSVRSGDRAKVLVPERFVRCGYELTPSIAAEKLRKTHAQEIAVFLESLGINSKSWTESAPGGKIHLRDHRAMDRFLNGLGFLYTRANGFGGSERKIFTKHESDLEDAIVWVLETRQVMTGVYYPPSGGWSFNPDYGDDYDYEPGGLDDRVSNKICRIRIEGKYQFDKLLRTARLYTDVENQQFKGLWIEASKLEKQEENESGLLPV